MRKIKKLEKSISLKILLNYLSLQISVLILLFILSGCGSTLELTRDDAKDKYLFQLSKIYNDTDFGLTLYDKDHSHPQEFPSNYLLKVLPGEYILEAKELIADGNPERGINIVSNLTAEKGISYMVDLIIHDSSNNSNSSGNGLPFYRGEFKIKEKKYNNVFQIDYNNFSSHGNFTSTSLSSDRKTLITQSEEFENKSAAYGLYYMHHYRVLDDTYILLRFGSIIGNYYAGRLVLGTGIKSYAYNNIYLNAEFNFGLCFSIPTGSKHSPSFNYSVSNSYYSFGAGMDISRWFSVILKYNGAVKDQIGKRYSSDHYGNSSSGQTYMDYMLTLGLEFGFF